MNQMDSVDPSHGRVLAAARIMHDPKSMRFGAACGTSEPLDPADLRLFDALATGIALPQASHFHRHRTSTGIRGGASLCPLLVPLNPAVSAQLCQRPHARLAAIVTPQRS
jgi:hypothetical protein